MEVPYEDISWWFKKKELSETGTKGRRTICIYALVQYVVVSPSASRTWYSIYWLFSSQCCSIPI